MNAHPYTPAHRSSAAPAQPDCHGRPTSSAVSTRLVTDAGPAWGPGRTEWTGIRRRHGTAEVRVMVVDDMPEMVEALGAALSEHGFAVVGGAHDGAEGVRLALEVQPDVVVMDVRMPRIDGIEATKLLLRHLPTVKVVLLTAYGDEALVQDGWRAGAAAYVLKGSSVADISAAIYVGLAT